MSEHVQCLLEREGAQQVAWIPAEKVKEGCFVELKEDGKFWRVMKAGDRFDSKIILANERQYASHRKGTDI